MRRYGWYSKFLFELTEEKQHAGVTPALAHIWRKFTTLDTDDEIPEKVEVGVLRRGALRGNVEDSTDVLLARYAILPVYSASALPTRRRKRVPAAEPL